MSSEELKFSDKSFLGIKPPEQMAKRLDKTELHEIVFLIELHQSGDESAKEIVENLFSIFENEMKYFFDQILELKSSEESPERSQFFNDFNEKLERISMKILQEELIANDKSIKYDDLRLDGIGVELKGFYEEKNDCEKST